MCNFSETLSRFGLEAFDYLERGAFGKVFPISEETVIKIGEIAQRELDALKSNLPHSPSYLNDEVEEGKGWVMMSRVEGVQVGKFIGTHPSDLPRQLATALKSLHNAGWTHGDIHKGNVLVDDSGNFSGFVDLGNARKSNYHLEDLNPNRWLSFLTNEEWDLFLSVYYSE
jgi:serine/threonine protein kinase